MKQPSWTIAVSVASGPEVAFIKVAFIEVTLIKKVLSCLVMLTGLLPLLGYASMPDGDAVPAAQATSKSVPAKETTPVSYAARTDQELNALLADWEDLRDDERRTLLREVKLRMIRSKERGSVIRIRTERRFGRIVRRADGKVVRIETGVIRVTPVPTDEQGYGVGFERRHAQQENSPAKTAPVLKVTDPSR